MKRLIKFLSCVPNVVYYCKWFTISVLINPFCDSGAAKYRCQIGSLIFFAVFNMHLENNYCSDTKFFPQPLISTTMTRCPANFINLSAIIVELRHGSKFRRDLRIVINGVTPDVFKIPPNKEY